MAIIPSDRKITWNPGVSGGIPTYAVERTVTDAPYNATGDGTTDDKAAIQSAIDDCTVGKAVYFPAGTYRISGTLVLNKGIALRGAGPSNTTIKIDVANAGVRCQSFSFGRDSYLSIDSGYTKDSTSLVLNDASSLSVGDVIYISQDDDDTLVNNTGAGSACTWCGPNEGDHCMGQLNTVTAIQMDTPEAGKDTITTERPLYYTFTAGLNPVVSRHWGMLEGAGIEDMKLEYATGVSDHSTGAISFQQAYGCWVKNVESSKTAGHHIQINYSYQCTVTECYLHEQLNSNYTAGICYGIFLYYNNSDHLIENNIIVNCRHHIAFEGGGSGCVIAYNYSKDPVFGTGTSAGSDFINHGAHPYMNLWEGNEGFIIIADNIWGSSSHNTYLRNNIHNINSKNSWFHWCVDLEEQSTYYNVVGNVLGRSGMSGYAYEYTCGSCQTLKSIWRLGCIDNSGNNTGCTSDASDTLLRHGNYDYVDNETKWDATIDDHTIPSSHYLASKPTFFGNVTWPPIGSDLSLKATDIPAKRRYNGETYPYTGTSSGVIMIF